MTRKPSRTKARADLERIVDAVLETGTSMEIEGHDRRVRVAPVRPSSKLATLVSHPGTIVGDPEDLVQMDWSGIWIVPKREGRR